PVAAAALGFRRRDRRHPVRSCRKHARSATSPARRVMRPGRRLLVFLALLTAALPRPAAAQLQELRASEAKLDSIRQEQSRLQEELQALRSRVRDASDELANIARQREASASALLELDYQTQLLTASSDSHGMQLAITQAQVSRHSIQLGRGLLLIFKRVPLHSVRVMFRAENLSKLLYPHRYSFFLACRHRAIVD